MSQKIASVSNIFTELDGLSQINPKKRPDFYLSGHYESDKK